MLCTEELHRALKRDLGTVKPLTNTSSSKHAAAYFLQKNITKKTYFEAPTKEAEVAAKEKFLAVNARNKLYVLPEKFTFERQVIDRAKSLIEKQFYDRDGLPKFTLGHAFNVGMVGKGANVDASSTDIWGKLFKSKLTATNFTLYRLYRGAICNHDTWANAEIIRASRFGICKLVSGNKMFYVPKDANIARVAATEPTLNMFGQIGYGKLLEDMLSKYHDIDLSVQQERNSRFAELGSLNGGFGTIDLQSASDTIGLGFCEYLLPPRMFKDLSFLRSPTTLVDGELVNMEMMSTMGNGFTFPLQTLIFASLILALYLETGQKPKIGNVRQYSVYGDDIIVKEDSYDMLVSVLTAAGFQVNSNKSFNTGKFRESCGKDFWSGVNVRAVYLQECNSPAHVYSLYNRLLDWSVQHDLRLSHTLRYLYSRAPILQVPMYEDVDAGFRTYERLIDSENSDRYGNKYYFAYEQVEIKMPVNESTIGSFYHGARIAFLHGTIKAHAYTPRKQGKKVYKVVKRRANLWWDLGKERLDYVSTMLDMWFKERESSL